jgi:hypothetical protein
VTTGSGRPPRRRWSWLFVLVVALVGSAAGAGVAYALGILDRGALAYFALFNAAALLLLRPRRYPGRF